MKCNIEKLILPFRSSLLYRALQLSRDIDHAEDLVQETMLLGISNLPQLKNPAKSKYWLSAILFNLFRKEYSRYKKLEYRDSEDWINVLIEDELPENETFERAHKQEIRDFVESLDDRLGVPLKMFHFHNLPYKEIATELNIPVGTVMSRISRARIHLKNKIEEQHLLIFPKPSKERKANVLSS